MTSLADIRSTFLDFYARQGHERVAASPLVPRNDPTLLFTNSGMVQFKNVFTGVEHRPYSRATTSQKCLRAGGKHNDLDNVGYTARHHTFFEMLGNFSFQDYFKEQAIPYAWELLTKDFGLNKEKLLVTVYHTDDEAAEIWKKVAGLPDEKIIRIPTDDNFWMMGPTGPCGPSSEIFYDHGEHIWGGPPGSPEEDGDRFIEIWNLVFMQFEQFEDGTRRPLDAPSIDTGMGLERIGALLQGKHDNYDTDLMRALIEASANATSADPDGPGKVHHRVIADHLRAMSFLIAEGVLPSNEGRGYVLRRIMRRAMRHAHLLGAKDPVMYRLVPALEAEMGAAYPELGQARALITETLKSEEERFRQTLDRGLKLLDDELAGLPEGAELPGEAAFKLYDTYGFPLDLTQDALREKGRSVETAGFDAAMAEQKAKARASWSGSGEAAEEGIWFDLADKHGTTDFLGYDTEVAEGQILALVGDGAAMVDSADQGAEVRVVLNQTPFYAESGGQVGDSGVLNTETGTVTITDCRKLAGVFVHIGRVSEGRVERGQGAELRVDHARRTMIRANHSATHLLNEALRQALGDHVAQRGSLNAPDRLRFDFSHNKALSREEIARIEGEVNEMIRQNSAVETRIMTPDDARGMGAQALFGEKYGDEVRVVSMGLGPTGKGPKGDTYSIELCGGTHVGRTGDIGLFALLSDSASSSGVRRIEALTGEAALAELRRRDMALAEIETALKTGGEDVAARVKALIEERRSLANEVAQLRRELAMSGGGEGTKAREINGVKLVAQVLTGVTGKDLPSIIDGMKGELGSGAVLLIAESGGKAAVAAGVTDDLTARLSAVDLLKTAVAELGGKGGGGRPDLAQGGAASAANAEGAFAAAEKLIGDLA
ncbi:alanine--tRNA ligase [Pseudoroseicyclus tamaricis]|uniref:Alanine--tRNA ligase n=1 Tax=Pseudoroseicyclus tamaricis TaxID=2705421 RepID=A0A6B2JRA9_9RHOB|nr:alanine--tRNA ligase [Pseudoroseicyclus tamaricis]NDV00708.1 alanine--tRNA ligase [Pseudoroseicyclus tamaricis]